LEDLKMSIPLAFNFEGDAFEVPPTAVGWRVKRMRTKGAPELVYSSDGVPLVIPLDTDMEDLRRIVVVPGKYRLDAVDEQQHVLKEVEVAYVLVPPAGPAPSTVETVAPDNAPNANAVLIEAMRQNSEIARTIVDRFPAMLEASAVLLRAADGAGLPARPPRKDDYEQHDDDDDDDEGQARRAGSIERSTSASRSGRRSWPSIRAWRPLSRARTSAMPASGSPYGTRRASRLATSISLARS
jgi:hypothetical protein